MAKAKVVKKEWYPIIAPKIFRGAVIGETTVYEPDRMIGKILSENLMNLTNDVKRQNIKINFEIVNVENKRALTDIIGYDMVQSSVRRLVRRNIKKMDMSFLCSTSDSKNVRIKPLIITRSLVSSSVEAKIRKNAQDFLAKHISGISYDNLANDLISHKLQDSLRAVINKIHPVRICEIRSMHLVREHKAEESAQMPAKKKAPKQEIKPKQAETKKPGEEPVVAA